MKIIKNIKVPTGNILITQGEYGLLECLSIGDYGKEKNIKADFMGLSREIEGVPNGSLVPLSEKWVITISTQYGCSMGCSFCDVPKVGAGRNASVYDLIDQVITAMSLHKEIASSKRLNIHYARMGEPTWNYNVIWATRWLKENIDSAYRIHPVVSTMMPKHNKNLKSYIEKWMVVKNEELNGEAGLQLSINSTNEGERDIMFNGNALSLPLIGEMMYGIKPKGRKITLNFALANYEINQYTLLKYFKPENFLIKITPMHMTKSCKENNLSTKDGYDNYYPYRDVENMLKSAGYDVIVFIPSKEEDESRITCGNAILADPQLVKPEMVAEL
jgi:23S rRNA (adenine2503-C2)-methyltransferase